MEVLRNFTEFSYLTAMLISLLAGLIMSFNPFIWGMASSLLAFQKRSENSSVLAVTLSFVVSFTVTFTLIGLLGVSFGKTLLYWSGQFEGVFNKLLAVVFFVLGCYVLGIKFHRVLKRVPLKLIYFYSKKNDGFRGSKPDPSLLKAFSLGTLFGLSPNPCTTPMLLAIIAYTATSGSLASGIPLLLLYGIGHSTPFLMVGWITGRLKKASWICRWHSVLNRTIGYGLMVVGLYFFME